MLEKWLKFINNSWDLCVPSTLSQLIDMEVLLMWVGREA